MSVDPHMLAILRGHLARERWPDAILVRIGALMLDGYLHIRHGRVPKTPEPDERLRFTPETIDWNLT